MIYTESDLSRHQSFSDNSHLFGIPCRIEEETVTETHGYVEIKRDIDHIRRLVHTALDLGIELHIIYKE